MSSKTSGKNTPRAGATDPSAGVAANAPATEFKNNVTRLLDSNRIHYQVHTYPNQIGSEQGTAVDVAQAIGLPPERVFKTLVVLADDPSSKPMLVLIPAADTLDLKAFAKAANLKKAKMATHQQAEQKTGLQTGGISPLALTAKPFRVYIDARALDHPTIAVSSGQRGANIELPAPDLIRITKAKAVELAPAS